jgi:predicted phage tail protein
MSTQIYIHGILAKKFGKHFTGFVKDAYSAIKLIDANKNGFFKALMDLNKKNIFYAIVCDSKVIENENDFLEKRSIKTINIIPLIVGSGAAVAVGLGLIIAETGKLTLMGTIVAGLVNAAISTAISLGISFLMSAINRQASPQISQQKIAVGGATAFIESKGKSYIFSNKQNLVSQGSAIPVGYGKMKTSSNLISASIKNYSTSQTTQDEFKLNASSSVLLDYIS